MTKAKLQAILERLGADSVKKRGRLLLVERGRYVSVVTHMHQHQITENDINTARPWTLHSIQSYEDAKGLINSIAERG